MNNVTSENYKKRLRNQFDRIYDGLVEQAEYSIELMERGGINIYYTNEICGEISLSGGKKVFYECKPASVKDPSILGETWINSIKDEEQDILVLHTPLNYRAFLLGNTDTVKYYTMYAVVHMPEDN